MNKPSAAHQETARRLLARQARDGEGAEARAAAAGGVYEKVVSYLGTLIGPVAARALFSRSVRQASADFPCLAKLPLDAEDMAEQLMLCLRGEAPEAVTETALALFSNLLALLGTLIGDRLTAKILRESGSAFPAASPPKEEPK